MTSVQSSTTGSSFPSASLNTWSGMETMSGADRMLHDESSDASSSYYFLQQFGSFTTQDEDEEHNAEAERQRQQQRQLDQSTTWSFSQNTATTNTTGTGTGGSLSQMLMGDYDDPDDVVIENSSDDDSSGGYSSSSSSSTTTNPQYDDDLPVRENGSDESSDEDDEDDTDESQSRIGIEPLVSYSFDTIMEMEDDDDENDKGTPSSRKSSRKKKEAKTNRRHSSSQHSSSKTTASIKSQDPYWNEDKTEEYSFFSAQTKPPQTLWELLRLQTLLGSCTQPRTDSFDYYEDEEDDLRLKDEDEEEVLAIMTEDTRLHSNQKKKKKSSNNTTKKEEQEEEEEETKQQPQADDGWVFFACGFHSAVPTNNNNTTATTTKKKNKKNNVRASPTTPNNEEDLSQFVIGEVSRQEEEEEEEKKQQDSPNHNHTNAMIDEALHKTKIKMKYLLGKIKRTTSANVRSVKLAASFTDETASILNYEKLLVEKDDDDKQDGGRREHRKFPSDELKKQAAAAAAAEAEANTTETTSKQQQQQPHEQEGMLCQFSDQYFASLGCYDPSTANATTTGVQHQQPQHQQDTSPSRSILDMDPAVTTTATTTPQRHEHLDFDDFGVDETTNNTRNVHTSWAQFDREFPRIAASANKKNNKGSGLNTSYGSNETATTAEETLHGSPVAQRSRRGSRRGPNNHYGKMRRSINRFHNKEGYDMDDDDDDDDVSNSRRKNSFPLFTDSYGGPGYSPNVAAKRYDSEYGRKSNEAKSYLLYQQRHKKSQHRLSKGLRQMKRRFSKTNTTRAEI